MDTFFGIPPAVLYGQLLVGLINGSFYALLSLGLAVIFGMLHVVNFAHGAMYMLGAFLAWLGLQSLGLSYWWSLGLVPLAVGLFGALAERCLLRQLAGMDPVFGLLLTFGMALVIEGMFRHWFGSSGRPYAVPVELRGGVDLGFTIVPLYRLWVVALSAVVCLITWILVERTPLGAWLRAATENPVLVQVFGINVPLMVTFTYAAGVALAGLAGVLAAPIYQVSPLMGTHTIVVVFAIVVIGGMGSIFGAVVTGYLLGLVEGLTKVFYPPGAAIVVFLVMVLVLLLRPAGLFGRGD